MAIDDHHFDKQLEKQMGCMAGFLQIFDRHHQFVPGKRISGPKRVPSFSATGSSSPSERSDLSFKESSEMFPSSPENLTAATPAPVIPSVPVFDFKEGMKNSWKLREAPRLSLDSRLRPRDIRTSSATASDADSDKNRRSPSVVARLMGLDALPDSAGGGRGGINGGGAVKQSELRRSASESRVSRDLNRFFDESFADDEIYKFRSPDFSSESKSTPIRPKPTASISSLQKRSCFNTQDFFPEPNRTGSRSTLDGEIERRLRMRGISEPAKDLETLKQILEALQLKGLLHSDTGRVPTKIQQHRRNLISDHQIVVMKPGPKPQPVRRSESEPPPRSGPVRRAPVRSRSPSSANPNPNPRRRAPNNAESVTRRISAVHSSSPKSSPRKTTPDRNRRMTKETVYSPSEDDNATTISECSASSTSLFDLERRVEYRAGRSLLERCDKLLHSIAAFTSAEQVTASDQQPSPVSVLDSSFLGEESSPSPVMKRSIQFKDPMAEWDYEEWVPATPTSGSRPAYVSESEYPDFAYVSNVLLASDRHPRLASDVYLLYLEKSHGAMGASSQSVLHRRLIFDTVNEILERKRHTSSWESFSKGRTTMSCGKQLIREVWLEVRRVREEVQAEDLNGLTCGAIRKDMACGDHGWGDTSAEMSSAVLHMERLVFKDLVVEMIQDLTDLEGSKARNLIPRRKLLF